MTTKTINGKWILFVQVPNDARNFKIAMKKELCYHDDYSMSNNIKAGQSLPYPIGSYHIIGLASNLTEDEWKGIVEGENDKTGIWYYDYEPMEGFWFDTATQSGQSLLQSLKLNLETTLIIEKK